MTINMFETAINKVITILLDFDLEFGVRCGVTEPTHLLSTLGPLFQNSKSRDQSFLPVVVTN